MEIILLILAYLLGSIPFALIIGKLAKGIDIRNYGSKNLGGTNAIRVLGLKLGILVAALDVIKASIIIMFFRFGIISYQEYDLFHPLIYGVAAIFGHFFPIFAGFRGGKGVACTGGVILVYQPLIFLCAVVIFTLVLIITRYVSLGSIITVAASVILAILIPNQATFGSPAFTTGRFDYWLIGFLSLASILIILSHQKNIKRLIHHEEARIQKRTKK